MVDEIPGAPSGCDDAFQLFEKVCAEWVEDGETTVVEYARRVVQRAVALCDERQPDESMSVGTTKLGGCPDLPRDVDWPLPGGKPLPFVAQLRLTDFAPFELDSALPRKGMLWFFYAEQTCGLAPEDRDGFAVLHSASAADLHRREPPDGTLVHRSYSVQPLPTPSVPRFTTSESVDVPPQVGRIRQGRNPVTGESITIRSPSSPAYRVEGDPLDVDAAALLPEFADHAVGHRALHQVLGFEHPGHGPFWRQVAIGADAHGLPVHGLVRGCEEPQVRSERWRLLFQLRSIVPMDPYGQLIPDRVSPERAPLAWGDGAVLYFMIRHDDLASARFDRMWCVAESC